MRTRTMAVAAALLMTATAGAFVAPLAAQSLADIAKKEEERRKTIKQPAKVLTNKDLKPVAAPEPAQAAAQADAPKDAAADTPKDAAKGASKDAPAKDANSAAGAAPAVKDQAYWSSELQKRQSQLSRDQIYAAALQSRVNALGTDFVNRDDPAQRAAIAGDRQRAVDELDRLNKQIVADQQAITELMEDARRAGVPPGWLR